MLLFHDPIGGHLGVYLHEENENMCSEKRNKKNPLTYANIHIVLAHNGARREATQMSISRRMSGHVFMKGNVAQKLKINEPDAWPISSL